MVGSPETGDGNAHFCSPSYACLRPGKSERHRCWAAAMQVSSRLLVDTDHNCLDGEQWCAHLDAAADDDEGLGHSAKHWGRRVVSLLQLT